MAGSHAYTMLQDPKQVLYDLVPLPDESRVLNLHRPGTELFLPDATRFRDVYHQELSPSDLTAAADGIGEGAQFDLIVLHDVFDREAALPLRPGSGPAVALLLRLRALLREGGILAIAVPNRVALSHWGRLLQPGLGGPDRHDRQRRRGNTYWEIRRLLALTQFTEYEMFAVSPACTSPRSLVAIDRVSMRRHYENAVVRMTEDSGWLKSTLIRTLVGLGVMAYFEPCFLIWAKK